MSNELEILKSLLSNFIGAVQQSGIITSAAGPIGGDYYAASIEALSKRITVLEAALSQAHDARERDRADAEEAVKTHLRENIDGWKDTLMDALEPRIKEWVAKSTGGISKDDLDEEIASYLNVNDYLDSDSIESKVEDMIDSHDFSTSPKMQRMVRDAVDEADLEDAVKNALDGITVNRYLDLSDLASEIESEIDFDSKVSDALDNIDLSDNLEIARTVQEKVDEKLADYDFSEALRNTLSDSAVREALLKMLVEDMSKKLLAEPEKKDE